MTDERARSATGADIDRLEAGMPALERRMTFRHGGSIIAIVWSGRRAARSRLKHLAVSVLICMTGGHILNMDVGYDKLWAPTPWNRFS